jgi:hypothetical protein
MPVARADDAFGVGAAARSTGPWGAPGMNFIRAALTSAARKDPAVNKNGTAWASVWTA